MRCCQRYGGIQGIKEPGDAVDYGQRLTQEAYSVPLLVQNSILQHRTPDKAYNIQADFVKLCVT